MDPILGTSIPDFLVGTAGDDTISGLAGDDFIQGEAGADLLQGNIGNDIIEGGAGDDTIEGGLILPEVVEPDDDTIFGNSGTDTAIFNGAFADFAITVAAVPLPDSPLTQPGFAVADTRSPATFSSNGTDLVADDVERLAFATEGSVLSLADFAPEILLASPVLTTIATTDTSELPASSPTVFVESIPVEVAADGTATEPVVIAAEFLAVEPATVAGVEADVIFTVEVLPTVGTLLLNGDVLSVGDSFVPADLETGALTYDIPEVITLSVGEQFPAFEFSVSSGPFTLESFPAIPGDDGSIANPTSAGMPLELSLSLFGAGVSSTDLDVDGSGAVEPAVDALNIFRVLAGAPQAVVIPDDIDINQQAIVDAVNAIPEAALDVDGSGTVDSAVDVLNIFRVLAGAPQAVVIPDGVDIDQQAIVDTVNALVA